MDDKTQQPQSQSHVPSPFMADMTDTPPRADVDEILRRKRKAREYKVRSHARPARLGWDKQELGKHWTPESATLGYAIRRDGLYSWTAAAAPRWTRTDRLPRPATHADNEKSNATRRCPARHASSANTQSYAPTTRRASRTRLRRGSAWAWARTGTTSMSMAWFTCTAGP